MTYQVLARKWRPRNFAEMTGQTHVVRALSNALEADRLHHAYLFTGTRGVGKTTIARILAKCLNCDKGVSASPCGECSTCKEVDEGRYVDLIEVDAASRAKVDETRDLMDNVQFAPARGRYKVYLIDEVHMFSAHSFNALLKTLEEPPPHVKFLLATTDPQKLPVTVLSRCQQFNLKGLGRDEISGQLTRILAAESVEAENSATRLIADAAEGSMRDALSLLDQAIAYGGGKLATDEVQTMLGTLERGRVRALLEAIAAGDAASAMASIETMATDVVDFGEALKGLLSELQRIAIAQTVPDALTEDEDDRGALLGLAGEMSPEDVQLYYQIGLFGRRDLPLAPDPRGGFEMIILRMLAFRPKGAPGLSLGSSSDATSPEGKPPDKTVARPAPEAPLAAVPANGGAARAEIGPAPTGSGKALTPQTWLSVLDELELVGLSRELASNAAFLAHTDGVLRLQLAPSHAQLANRQVEDTLRLALEAHCGGPLRLDVQIEKPEQDTLASIAERESQERKQAALRAIQSDPKVGELCDTFGASIDESSIQPLDQ